MQLLTDKDMALLIEMTVRQLEDMKYLYPAVDRSPVEARLARLGATREHLSRVKFAEPDDIATARNTYCWSDDSGIQIDDDARVSYGDNVIWVGAWVAIGGKGPGE